MVFYQILGTVHVSSSYSDTFSFTKSSSVAKTTLQSPMSVKLSICLSSKPLNLSELITEPYQHPSHHIHHPPIHQLYHHTNTFSNILTTICNCNTIYKTFIYWFRTLKLFSLFDFKHILKFMMSSFYSVFFWIINVTSASRIVIPGSVTGVVGKPVREGTY